MAEVKPHAVDSSGLGEVIWRASRADEGTISVAGADIVAQAIRDSDFVKQVRVSVLKEALEFTQTEQCPVTAPGSGDPCYRIEGHEGPHSQQKGPFYKPEDFTLKAFLQKIERES